MKGRKGAGRVTIHTDRVGFETFEAAFALRDALLAVEWGGKTDYFDGFIEACPDCSCSRSSRTTPNPHDATCRLDAALTKAGIATQEQRDALRKEIGL